MHALDYQNPDKIADDYIYVPFFFLFFFYDMPHPKFELNYDLASKKAKHSILILIFLIK